MKNFLITGIAAAALMSAGAAFADSQTYTATVAPTTTNFTTSLALPKFDPTLGTLTSIDFGLSGDLTSAIKFESLDSAPSTITAQSSGSITLTRPDTTTLVVVLPTNSQSFNASAFDGTIDFGGTSGATFPAVVASGSGSFTSTTPADFSLFSGTGDISLPVTAVATSNASGSGNLIQQVNTQADASAFVRYNYTASVVPEPAANASLALGSLGLLGLILRGRRRR